MQEIPAFMTEKTSHPPILSREELEAKIAEADALAEMKANLLATISHEIRTPMQTIYGLLELIDDEKPSARIAEMVSTAQTAVDYSKFWMMFWILPKWMPIRWSLIRLKFRYACSYADFWKL
jgi:signal transduction histidine kinase